MYEAYFNRFRNLIDLSLLNHNAPTVDATDLDGRDVKYLTEGAPLWFSNT